MVAPIVIVAIALTGQAVQTNIPPQQPADDSQMSLAERAAAARAAAANKPRPPEWSHSPAPPPLTPEQRGLVSGSRYVNDFLRLQIELANRWEPLSADRMALDQEMAHKYLTLSVGSSSHRVLWVGDSAGRNVVLSIMPVPPDAPSDLDKLAEGLKTIALAQLSRVKDLTEYKEEMLLGDAEHKFAAFRIAATVRDARIVQSVQVTRSNGFLLSFFTTGRSDQDVSDALRSLHSSLAWRSAKP